MKTVAVGVIFVILHLFLPQSCPQESSFRCGQRPVKHPERDNKYYVGKAYPGQWPWYGIIYHRKPNSVVEYACGGTLISERHVLTSMLCAKSKNGTLLNSGDVLFRIGTRKQNVVNIGYAQHRQVIKIHQPVDHNKTSSNEIVILELRDKVKFNKYVQPACVRPKSPPHFFGNRLRIVIGWGLPEGNDYLENYNASCSTNYLFNSTAVCGNDRGGLIHHWNDNVSLDVAQHIYGIIDCNKEMTCNNPFFIPSGIIFLWDYQTWIAETASLDYLRKVRKGQTYDPSKRYPNLLPRRNCGNILIGNVESGPNAQLFEFPWMALIFWRDIDDGKVYELCTGTLISNRYVLTSAVSGWADDPAFVRLGEYDKGQNPDCIGNDDCAPPYRDYDVEFMIEHPDAKRHIRFLLNDIALIRTKKPVVYEDHIQPVCLPVTHDLKQKRFTQYVLTGWNVFSGEFSKSIESIDEVTERSIYINNETNFNAIKCTNQSDFKSPGSSLGNIVNHNGMRFVQFGLLLTREPRLIYYTYLPYYMDWIIANMEE